MHSRFSSEMYGQFLRDAMREPLICGNLEVLGFAESFLDIRVGFTGTNRLSLDSGNQAFSPRFLPLSVFPDTQNRHSHTAIHPTANGILDAS